MTYSNLWNQVIYFPGRIRIIPPNNLQAIQVRDVQYDLGSAWAVGSGKGHYMRGLTFVSITAFPGVVNMNLTKSSRI